MAMTEPFIVTAPPRGQRIPDVLAPFAGELADDAVTDLFVNGSHGLFVDRGRGADPVPHWRASEREVRELASALIGAGGRHIDDAHPCVDVRLPGGYRVHAVLAPVAASGTAISIRVPRAGRTGMAGLADADAFGPGVAAHLRAAVARRANFLVSGAAGVGKTTLLSALLSEAPPDERIVTIEDVVEIELDHPHHVALEARQANLEGAGAVSLAALVREALRMKPDRLVIGECRGAEVRELLTALNTGHDGGAGTVHANSIEDVATRLEALGALAGMSETALARQVVSALDFVVHLARDRNGRRHVAAIGEFEVVGGRLVVAEVPVAEARDEAVPRGGDARSAPRSGAVAASAPAIGPQLPSGATPAAPAPNPGDDAAEPAAAPDLPRTPSVPASPPTSVPPADSAADAFDALVRGYVTATSPAEPEPEPAAAGTPTAAPDRFTPRPPVRRATRGGGHAAA